MLWTLLLVVVLASAGAGIAVVGTQDTATDVAPPSAEPTPAPSPPPPPGASPLEPVSPTPSEESTSRTPAPPSVTASACPALTEEVVLRVLTLNVHSGYGPGGFDVGRIADLVERWRVDVALLQEVDRHRAHSRFVDMPAVLARETGMEVAFGVNVRQGRGEYGVATLSRHPITFERNTLLPTAPGLQQRGVLRTDLDVHGATVSVFNTHLEHRSPPTRLRQLAAARDVVGQSPHPVVLGGDLNSAPGSPTMRLARTFVRDAWADAGSGPGATVPAATPRARIDYLMYAPPLRVSRAEVLSPVVSDHRGVRAKFILSVAGDEVCVPQLDGPLDGSGAGGDGAGGDR
ncbi:MAG TPA: endonuclease/exonuclease/phosphatase family protein [Nocardioides sp.]|nr:endonuclease/exonuclease/phosphatase family protein [Nocardioides sp.]